MIATTCILAFINPGEHLQVFKILERWPNCCLASQSEFPLLCFFLNFASVYVYVYVYVSSVYNVCIYVHMYICVCVYAYVQMYVCVYVCTYVCVCSLGGFSFEQLLMFGQPPFMCHSIYP